MLAIALLASCTLLLFGGCDRGSAPPTGGSSAPPAATTAATSAAPAPSTSHHEDLTMPKPKAHAHTAAADLGTLPAGVGIAVGQVAPDFTLPDAHGKPVRLYDVLKRSAVLLVFYRGGW